MKIQQAKPLMGLSETLLSYLRRDNEAAVIGAGNGVGAYAEGETDIGIRGIGCRHIPDKAAARIRIIEIKGKGTCLLVVMRSADIVRGEIELGGTRGEVGAERSILHKQHSAVKGIILYGRDVCFVCQKPHRRHRMGIRRAYIAEMPGLRSDMRCRIRPLRVAEHKAVIGADDIEPFACTMRTEGNARTVRSHCREVNGKPRVVLARSGASNIEVGILRAVLLRILIIDALLILKRTVAACDAELVSARIGAECY